MSAVGIYDVARVAFASALMDWRNHPMAAAIPHSGYVFTPAVDVTLSTLFPLPVPAVPLTAQKIDSAGFLQCGPIFFPTSPPNVLVTSVVIYRVSDQMLVFNISFPAIVSATGKAIVLVQGYSHPGLCRL